ncbi:MAG: hypothetical protein AC479_00500 [miscellaneous Crenarchaeota group-6 archaeon AD8-1]|nr:MAG: hypothetical protein AC479_00500 [miscellaneous Crenarchaeota group-6 archaeon AD8-1]
MQESQKKRLETMMKSNKPKPKRTTIILEPEERKYIDSLIQEGKESGIKSLISKMLDIHKKLMIDDWRFPGEYYSGISRIAFVNVELINIMLNQIPKEKWINLGQEMGKALKISIETILNIQVSEIKDWKPIFDRLSVQGFGDFFLKDKYILIKNPFINYANLWQGILEGMLDIKLSAKTNLPPLVFQIKAKEGNSIQS